MGWCAVGTQRNPHVNLFLSFIIFAGAPKEILIGVSLTDNMDDIRGRLDIKGGDNMKGGGATFGGSLPAQRYNQLPHYNWALVYWPALTQAQGFNLVE